MLYWDIYLLDERLLCYFAFVQHRLSVRFSLLIVRIFEVPHVLLDRSEAAAIQMIHVHGRQLELLNVLDLNLALFLHDFQ